MKVAFKTKELERLYSTPLNEIRGKQKFSKQVIKQYQAKVRILTVIDNLKDLHPIKSLNFEALSGDRKGQYSIRLNKQFRLIIIEVKDELIEIEIIEISKHYE
ncbi:type II toxin-antitoxin system RelE/ParE family toxin [Ekhidna sp.]|uniref:type II toxin-antitoxin system RelE/ParE family toxin n=1 Tax=Ekhidna sp. TaxID=2608089 RepID=UPI0032EF235F